MARYLLCDTELYLPRFQPVSRIGIVAMHTRERRAEPPTSPHHYAQVAALVELLAIAGAKKRFGWVTDRARAQASTRHLRKASSFLHWRR